MGNINSGSGSDETARVLAMFASAFLAFLPSMLLALSVDIAGGVDYLHHSFDPRGSREGPALAIAFGGGFVMGVVICWALERPETEKVAGAITKLFSIFNAVMWPAVIGTSVTAMFTIPIVSLLITPDLGAHFGKLAVGLSLVAVACGVWGWRMFIRKEPTTKRGEAQIKVEG